ncbi:MAG: urease accessory protein UreD [Polaromonas sp.]
MTWHAQLQLDYRLESGKTVARHTHSGPLRVLHSLYPEGPAVCHNVLVHPPGGLVGGDLLDIRVQAHAGAHGLITTPGATRYYRCDGQAALQRTHLALAAGARLEWLPQEAICYNACLAENRLTLALEPGAELLGWDVTALGLPLAGQPFVQGHFHQHLELPGVWLERSTLAASDSRLLDSAVGLAGQRCMALAFFITGSPMERNRRQQALDCARAAMAHHPLAATAGVTSPHPQVIVARALAPVVEPAMDLMRQVRAAWRADLWEKTAQSPRIWAT